jgi:hypothetical protein
MRPSVLLVLDLREYREPPADAAGYRRLWAQLEPELLGRDLTPSGTVTLDRAPRGRVGAIVVEAAGGAVRVDANTSFAVCGVLEPPKLLYRCGPCGDAGQVRYGPFVCIECGPADTRRRVCDDHVVILDLTFAKATCPAHVPSCGCGQTATFWCAGPGCRRRRAWCDRHRRRHPGDDLTSYCEACYDQRFPACSTAGCSSTGSLACEFTGSGAGSGACGTRVCPRHGFRWQVYGPQKRGLVLCPEHHRRLPALSPEDLVLQIIAGTVRRRGRARLPRLPRLSTVRHIFINVRRQLLSIADLYAVADRSVRDRGDPAVRSLIDEHRPGWQAEVQNEVDTVGKGRLHFAQLQSVLVGLGFADMAPRVTFSEFKPHSGDLYVRVPDDLKARFIGRQGSTIKAIQQRLGLTVKLERL